MKSSYFHTPVHDDFVKYNQIHFERKYDKVWEILMLMFNWPLFLYTVLSEIKVSTWEIDFFSKFPSWKRGE